MSSIAEEFLKDGLEQAYKCVHCGFCLQTCPTYLATGNEADSPRGRIYLVKALLTGGVDATESVLKHLSQCVICRRCETACPSGVEYSRVIYAAYAYLGDKLVNYDYPIHVRLGYRLITEPTIINAALSLGEKLPSVPNQLKGFIRSRGDVRISELLGREYLPPSHKSIRGTVVMFATDSCITWQSYAYVVLEAIRVLTWNGYRVLLPRGFSCCGAPYMHMGDFKTAAKLALNNLRRLSEYWGDADYFVIVNSGGCQAQWLEYPHLVKEGELGKLALELRGKLVDVMQVLDMNGLDGVLGSVRMRLSIQHSCHLMNVAKAHEPVVRVLSKVPGVEVRGLDTADICCGAGNMYPDRHPEIAEKVLRLKVEDIESWKPDALIVESPSCMSYLSWALPRVGVKVRLMYPISIIDMAYRAGGNPGYIDVMSRSRVLSEH
ncbi:MAG: (Fe-S)-binding protein [Vulcanisaeta sp. AZ3]